ncbi:MAG: N-acetylmuramoyl-L-alanine amidase [Pseudomonadota bacterium]
MNAKFIKTLFGFAIGPFLFVLLSVLNADAQNASNAHNSRISGDIKQTRLVIDLSEKINFRFFTLSDPYRVIIDMPNVNFRLPPGSGDKGRGLILAYRYGVFAPGKSRVVIDLIQPALVKKAYSLPATNDQPARLVMDFASTDRKTYLAAQLEQRKRRLREAARQKRRKKAGASQEKQPDLAIRRKKSSKTKKPVVTLDPGHGGIDPGAIGVNGTKEKDVVLAFGKLLRKKLKQKERYDVIMTRSTDVFIPLRGRVKFARDKDADLFVSLHADSIARQDASVRGASVYTLSENASDEQARLLALAENKSDIIAGVDLSDNSDAVSDILIDLARRETKNHSVAFANILINSMREATRVKKEPLRFANFAVLRAPDIPSVLVELAYLSSFRDEELLQSSAWREKVADAVALAIDNYFASNVAVNPY